METSRNAIALKYLRSWLVFDAALVILDLVNATGEMAGEVWSINWSDAWLFNSGKIRKNRHMQCVLIKAQCITQCFYMYIYVHVYKQTMW